jgi:hypothetical protein
LLGGRRPLSQWISTADDVGRHPALKRRARLHGETPCGSLASAQGRASQREQPQTAGCRHRSRLPGLDGRQAAAWEQPNPADEWPDACFAIVLQGSAHQAMAAAWPQELPAWGANFMQSAGGWARAVGYSPPRPGVESRTCSSSQLRLLVVSGTRATSLQIDSDEMASRCEPAREPACSEPSPSVNRTAPVCRFRSATIA